jgi:hypothetical protein
MHSTSSESQIVHVASYIYTSIVIRVAQAV